MRIEIPDLALVALVGASSSGKTTFASKHFLKTEVLSSDFFRGMVCDDENDQSASKAAFDLLFYAADKRLRAGKTTVIDATNAQSSARKQVIDFARSHDVIPVAIVFNVCEKTLMKRNAERADRRLPGSVIKRHCGEIKKAINTLKKEGFRYVYVLNESEIDDAEVVRNRLWNDKRDLCGPFDIIGDVHGCFDELVELLTALGYEPNDDGAYSHPDGRTLIFVGDLCDRGPRNVDVLRLVMASVKAGIALAVPGNHDVKLLKYLQGKNVRLTNGLSVTVKELEGESAEFRGEVKSFIDGLISHYVLDGGRLVAAHAGIKEEFIGRGSARVRDFCLYGDVTGEKDEYDFPVRLDWASDYRGKALVVYGHTPHGAPVILNNTYNVDTGCVFGGSLTALRYPERQTVSVPARREYAHHARPLFEENGNRRDELAFTDVGGKMFIQTRLMSVSVGEGYTAAALEAASRTVDPHWLIYLPPTMSPCETAKTDGYLEYPHEAFAYYRSRGMKNVVCERKHMGSRAVVVLCRSAEVAKLRFGAEGIGVIYTRTGRRFFEGGSAETQILERLNAVLEKTGFWNDFDSEWVCLDTELMPWSQKAMTLLREHYAPVGRSGRDAASSAVRVLEKACETAKNFGAVSSSGGGNDLSLEALLQTYRQKSADLERYTEAYREYCWQVESVDDIRIAPFHILATEGKVYDDRTHVWHMETIKKYMTGVDPVFIATEYFTVDTEDEADVDAACRRWEKLTEAGGEGMVVKPEVYTAVCDGQLLQPAVKCRGREYLRIIYGPEYLAPANLSRLKKRSLSRKRDLALKEFSLGMEALRRFVASEPLYKVHQCVYGVLGLESEPVDPRL